MKILVTGATGFLGQHLVAELLGAGHAVRVLVRDASARTLPWGSGVEVAAGDLLDVLALEEAVRGVAGVIHAAAMVSFQRRDRARLRQVNETGTARVVDACVAAGVRLIHVSSIGAVGRRADGGLINEQTPWQEGQAASAYAKSKRRAELEVYRGIAEGLHALIVNPGLVLGPGDWQAGTPRIFRTVAEGLRFRHAGTNGLVGAGDVARACRLLLEAPNLTAGERYILVAENWPYDRFLGQIAHALGRKPPRWVIPRRVALLAGWTSERLAALTGQAWPLTLENMRSATQHHRYDGRKIEALGLRYTPIESVIAETAAAYRAAYPLRT